jgi:LysM repeat protein
MFLIIMHHTRFKYLSLFFLTFIVISLVAQNKSQLYVKYIDDYSKLAVIQQKEHGIPASITLAQGLLESGAGQSVFAKSSNNHFGIKCHDWSGDKVYYDDDAKGECFRKYDNVLQSYEDHSAFLKQKPRYSFLFELSPTDYESWAHGLKKAGYATDPSYAYKLISIIENYELHKYDLLKEAHFKSEIFIGESKKLRATKAGMGSIQAESLHQVYKNNHIKFVVSKPGDSYATIADEFEITEKKLRDFNEINATVQLVPGTQVYIQKKKNKAARGNNTHIVRVGDSMYIISQIYGVKLEKLYKMNDMPYTQGAQLGQVVKLR